MIAISVPGVKQSLNDPGRGNAAGRVATARRVSLRFAPRSVIRGALAQGLGIGWFTALWALMNPKPSRNV